MIIGEIWYSSYIQTESLRRWSSARRHSTKSRSYTGSRLVGKSRVFKAFDLYITWVPSVAILLAGIRSRSTRVEPLKATEPKMQLQHTIPNLCSRAEHLNWYCILGTILTERKSNHNEAVPLSIIILATSAREPTSEIRCCV